MRKYRRQLFACLGLALWVAAAPAIAADASVTRTINRGLPAASAQTLAVDNLLGRVTVEPADGDPRVVATIRASAHDHAQAEALAKTIRITSTNKANHRHLHVEYPLSRYTVYRYSGSLTAKKTDSSSSLGRGLITFLHVFWGNTNASNIEYDGHPVRIVSGSTSDGVALHVDLAIYLPKGTAINLDNKVGVIHVRGVASATRLKLSTGRVVTDNTHGALDITTGSGDVAITNQNGNTRIVTGSGDIAASDVTGAIKTRQGSGDFHAKRLHGELTARTGSGDIDVRDLAGGVNIRTGSGDFHGQRLHDGLTARTGSGDIQVRDLTGGLNIRTGSGDVNAGELAAVSSADVHTGSGDITLAGDLSQLSALSIAAGSGDIVLKTAQPPAMRVLAQTMSGDIGATWRHAHNSESRKGYFVATYGSGKNSGDIKSGSGDITLSGS